MIDTQVRQVGLSIAAEQTTRPDKGERIVEALPLALEKTKDRKNIQLPAELRHGLYSGASNRLGDRGSLFARLETITGQRTLRKNYQGGSLCDREPGEGIHALEIGILFSQAHVHLDRGNSKFFHHEELAFCRFTRR